MKRLLYIFVAVFVLACDSEQAGDCFQNTGEIIRQEIEVPGFSKVLVNRNVALVLKQGAEQQVIIESQKQTIQNQEQASTEQTQVLQMLLKRVEALEKDKIETNVKLVKN